MACSSETVTLLSLSDLVLDPQPKKAADSIATCVLDALDPVACLDASAPSNHLLGPTKRDRFHGQQAGLWKVCF